MHSPLHISKMLKGSLDAISGHLRQHLSADGLRPCVCLFQMDEVLKGLGPKENPDRASAVRIVPSARLVGEGSTLTISSAG